MKLLQRFRRLSLDRKLIASYLVILGLGGLAISLVGSWIVSTTLRREAERTVTHDLAVVRAAYDHQLQLMARTLAMAAAGGAVPQQLAAGDGPALEAALRELQRIGGFDLVVLTDAGGATVARVSAGPALAEAALPDAAAAALRGRAASATELLPVAPRRSDVAEASSTLAMVAAAPVDSGGTTVAGLWAAVVLDGRSTLPTAVWQRLYADEPGAGAGTVGLFRGDLRVASAGGGAEAVVASPEVVAAVLGKAPGSGGTFLRHDGYVSAYEPIRDPHGVPVGMLQVGLREDLHAGIRNRVISSFFAIAAIGFALVIAITYRITHALTRPVREMVEATQRIAGGRFDRPVAVDAGGELGLLAESINRMQGSLQRQRGELEEAAQTLEAKVRARSDELGRMQVRMAQSERLASIGVLAAGVAHEVNNPLGTILALTELTIEDLPTGHPCRADLQEVAAQARRCGDIVRHLLEFSRQHEASPQPVDVGELLAKTLGLLERQASFQNVRVERRLAADLPPVVADPLQLQQVFVNILVNAVQAMDERGTLTLGSGRDRATDEVVLTFTDTGCGIPAEQIGHVFDPFFTTKESGEGTGLGLAIAYGIVSRYGGSIAVESQPGAGTTFTIRLPEATAAAAAAPAEESLVTTGG